MTVIKREKETKQSPVFLHQRQFLFSIRFLLIKKKTGTAIHKIVRQLPHLHQKCNKKGIKLALELMAGDGLLYF